MKIKVGYSHNNDFNENSLKLTISELSKYKIAACAPRGRDPPGRGGESELLLDPFLHSKNAGLKSWVEPSNWVVLTQQLG